MRFAAATFLASAILWACGASAEERALLVAAEPINFFQETIDGRDQNGNIMVDFPTLSHTATRAIKVAPRRSPPE